MIKSSNGSHSEFKLVNCSFQIKSPNQDFDELAMKAIVLQPFNKANSSLFVDLKTETNKNQQNINKAIGLFVLSSLLNKSKRELNFRNCKNSQPINRKEKELECGGFNDGYNKELAEEVDKEDKTIWKCINTKNNSSQNISYDKKAIKKDKIKNKKKSKSKRQSQKKNIIKNQKKNKNKSKIGYKDNPNLRNEFKNEKKFKNKYKEGNKYIHKQFNKSENKTESHNKKKSTNFKNHNNSVDTDQDKDLQNIHFGANKIRYIDLQPNEQTYNLTESYVDENFNSNDTENESLHSDQDSNDLLPEKGVITKNELKKFLNQIPTPSWYLRFDAFQKYDPKILKNWPDGLKNDEPIEFKRKLFDIYCELNPLVLAKNLHRGMTYFFERHGLYNISYFNRNVMIFSKNVDQLRMLQKRNKKKKLRLIFPKKQMQK
ncbi:hypothetical protein M0812_21149 [Anaeramoeba flamelloides]|uniref:Uncharacterized protein n=2 Tax=Anaeramoeba flamelloides TaxID=1746091 RepID=A0AAV7YR15_9EUKA|nr:hypothetical protein M0812_21149 [Anaeramoeba flamelloides]